MLMIACEGPPDIQAKSFVVSTTVDRTSLPFVTAMQTNSSGRLEVLYIRGT